MHGSIATTSWKFAAAALILALLFGAYLFWRARDSESITQQPRPPAPAVATAVAGHQVWRTRLTAVGTLEAQRGVEITTAAPGIVEATHFDSGDDVERGAPIAQLDDDADRARLATLTAQIEQAQNDLNRIRRLFKGGAISTADAEQAATAVETLRAQIEEQRALIDNKQIEAPFSGELGIRQIDLGQYVQPGEPIVSLQQIAPIFINFTLPERHYGQLDRGQRIELFVDAWPEHRFEGVVSAVNPQIDPRTRNFQVQGLLANDERLLRPGMFAQVQVILPERRDVVTVPVTAISHSPAGDSVFVVRQPQADEPAPEKSADSRAAASRSRAPATVARVPVETGERRGTHIAVLKGIEAGDAVVTAGQLKLFEGSPVRVSAGAPPPAPRTARR